MTSHKLMSVLADAKKYTGLEYKSGIVAVSVYADVPYNTVYSTDEQTCILAYDKLEKNVKFKPLINIMNKKIMLCKNVSYFELNEITEEDLISYFKEQSKLVRLYKVLKKKEELNKDF